MTKIQMIQTIGVSGIAIMILFLSLGHLIFEFVSRFDFRILPTPEQQNMSAEVKSKPGPLDSDFYLWGTTP
jgi:Na+-transporting methylmalonyl-CoA/oxaloacetate decarboxylase gamma subunit